MTTPFEFAEALLDAGGWPKSTNNLMAVVAWEALEGGHYYNGAKYNPMNTMQGMPGSHNAVGQVQAYTSWDQGLAATLKTLTNGLYNKTIQCLAASADPVDTLDSLTTWTGGTAYNTSAIQSQYKSYANHPDPTGESLSSTGGLLKKIVLGALGIAGFAYLWSKTK